VRTLLREHIETMAELGIVFHHTFTSDKLGFSIALARYGEKGREFVNIEETMPHCEVPRPAWERLGARRGRTSRSRGLGGSPQNSSRRSTRAPSSPRMN